MLVVVVLTATVFSLGGFINADHATKFDDISIVPTFVLTPLTYLGGVFYSINLLSPFWQTVSLANPVVYMVNAYRYGILGVSDVSVGVSIGMLLLFTAALYAWAITLLNREPACASSCRRPALTVRNALPAARLSAGWRCDRIQGLR